MVDRFNYCAYCQLLYQWSSYLRILSYTGRKYNSAKFYDDTIKMYNRLQKDSCIAVAISYGSLSKGKWHNSSDIDIRFIPQKGEWNFWKACFVGLRERALAFLKVSS